MERKNFKFGILVIFFMSFMFFSACNGGDGNGDNNNHSPKILKLTLNPSNPKVGENLTCSTELSDEDGDLISVEFSWEVNGGLLKKENPGVNGLYDNAQSMFDLQVKAGDEVKCYVIVYDKKGNKASDYAKVIIAGQVVTNTPPVFSKIPDVSVIIGQAISGIDLRAYASDTQDSDQNLTFVITSQSNTDVILCNPNSSGLIGSDVAKKSGYSDVSVKVTDKGGLSATTTFRITVALPNNTAPSIVNIADQYIKIGEQIEPINLSLYVSDKEDTFSKLKVVIKSQTNSNAVACLIENGILKSQKATATAENEVVLEVSDTGNLKTEYKFTVTVESIPVTYQLFGLDFSPYINNQDPNLGSTISEQQLRSRMQIVAPYTKWVRTFGAGAGLENAGKIAHELGLKIAAGAWLSKDKTANTRELNSLINMAQNGQVDCAIVGSETLLRGDLSADDLLGYINEFKNAVPNVPLTTADVYAEFVENPKIISACDLIFANFYPYWEGVDLKNAIVSLYSDYQEIVEASQGKEVWISETGWPSAGNTIGSAVPSLANANYYFLNFISWARAENVNSFIFEAFDEPWKAAYEGPQGAHWGIWDKDGNMKSGMQDVFDGKTMPNNWSCATQIDGPGDPEIIFTFTPPKGSTDNLQGKVSHVIASKYGVAVYIKVGGWWTKPYWNNPLSTINCDGTWQCDITTGGNDSSASEIAAFLVLKTYSPPGASGGGLSTDLDANSVAKLIVTR